jgi:hypothetical protein
MKRAFNTSFRPFATILTLILVILNVNAENSWLKPYNVVWDSPSTDSEQSMPCGGGDIGLNVWVENGDILMYVARSGTFDELNGFPKIGRIRVTLSPNPFDEGNSFRQELKLKEGCVEISGTKDFLKSTVSIWVDVKRPVIHINVSGDLKTSAVITYENWRLQDRELANSEKESCRSWLGTSAKAVQKKDDVTFLSGNAILFYHQNRDTDTGFDLVVKQQGLNPVKEQLWNPLKNLVFGGILKGKNFIPDGNIDGIYASTPFRGWRLVSRKPAFSHEAEMILHTDNAAILENWESGLAETIKNVAQTAKTAKKETQEWWDNFWTRSYIRLDEKEADPSSKVWQVGRNYQLFRYQLACNAYGKYPTKFNGGLFTFDPQYIDPQRKDNPDFRRWGGGSFTAQNQRLVYWPMLKSGDFDMMKPQFDFYLRSLHNAELRTELYWGHKGASFTEQIENFALPVAYEYGWNRPENYDPGEQYNDWVEYQWDTAFEFCLMILDMHQFNGADISEYIPLIESCLRFYDEHYQYLSRKRTTKALDYEGHLVLYPGTACETYKVANNAVSTVAALQTVLVRLLDLDSTYLQPENRQHWEEMLTRIPPISFREMNGHKVIAPAKSFERINNTEIPQLYPVFPYGIFGIGKPNLDVAIDTWKYGIEKPEQKNYISWHQDNIFCARMGLTEEASELTIKKLENAPRRFPTWWGPGNDWVPDHNWGGSGMIGLQEMLMQADGNKIYLFPAWPLDWDVTFKLNAPYNTTVSGRVADGIIKDISVEPKERRKDVSIFLYKQDHEPFPLDSIMKTDSVTGKDSIYISETIKIK